jgi:hypothetical protein
MTNKINHIGRITFPIFFIFLVQACASLQCTNSNDVFDLNLPESKIYKDELARQLKLSGDAEITYYVDKYVVDKNIKYLYVSVRGETICATAVLKVMNVDKNLEQFDKVKGVSYRNAEIENLKFDIIQDPAKTEFIYKSLDGFID